MATIQELEAALVKADAAGNADDARAFANEIRKMRSGSQGSANALSTQSTNPQTLPQVGGARGFLGDLAASGARYSTPGLIARMGNAITGGQAGATGEQVDEFGKGAVIGAGKALSDLGQGARKLGTLVGNSPILPSNIIRSVAGAGPMVSNEAVDRMMGELQAKARTDKTLENVPGSTTGEIMAGLLTGAAMPLRGAQAANLAAKAPMSTAMGTGAAYGAGFGAMNPNPEQSPMESGSKGAVLGAALPAALGTAGKAATVLPFLKSSAQRAAETVQQSAEPNRAVIERLLRNPPQALPGEQLTAGRATTGAQVPEFAALANAAENRLPTPYLAIENAAENARMNAIGSFAGDKASLAAEQGRRAGITKPLYDQMKAQEIPINPELKAIIDTPAGQLAFERARTIAANRMKPFGVEFDKQGVPQKATGQALQDLKIAMDALATDPTLRAQHSIGNAEAAALGKLSESLVGNLNKNLPGFDLARSTHAAESVLINQMNLGQYLQGKMTAPLADTGAILPQRAAIYANALRDDAGTAVRKSLDRPLPGKIEDYLTPENLKISKEVNRSYGRGAEQDRLSNLGQKELARILGSESGDIKSPTFFNTPVSATKTAINYLSGKATDKAMLEIAQKLQTPQGALELLLRQNHSRLDPYLNNFIATQAPGAVYRAQ